MNDFSEKNMDSVTSCNWFKGSDIRWHPTLVLMKFRCEPRAAYKFTANAHGSWEAHGDMFTAKSWKVEVKPQKSQANRKPFPKKNMTISHPMTIRWHPAMTLVSSDEILKPRATAASNSLQFWDAIDAYLRHMAEVFSRVTSAWNYFINTCNDFVRLDACDASLQMHVNEAWNLYHCSAWKHDKTHDFSCCIRQCNYASLILGEMSFFSVMFASMLEASESSEDVHARLQPAETWLVTVSPRRLPFDGRKQLKRSQPEGSQGSRRLLWRFTWKSSRRFSWRFFLKVKMFQSFELVPQTKFRSSTCRMSDACPTRRFSLRHTQKRWKSEKTWSNIIHLATHHADIVDLKVGVTVAKDFENPTWVCTKGNQMARLLKTQRRNLRLPFS